MSDHAEQLRKRILDLVSEYHQSAFARRPFLPGVTPVPPAGRVFDDRDMRSLTDSALDFWLTTGRFAEQFEKRFAAYFGLKHASLVNSGSSANLIALTALTSKLLGDDRLVPGDEVITAAAGFPTTVAPIVQNGLIPVFIDVHVPTYNIDPALLEAALSPRTRAVMLAHTLGNPFDLDAVTAFCRKHDLWLIEDCCDALGSTYRGQKVGTFGDLATVSFFPAHHITMGEGGCVLCDRKLLQRSAESFRDWGRDCWCAPGKDNTCGMRFDWQLGDLPHGYDHKYIYSHIGYNLKLTDMQAAVGVAQLDKLDGFIAARKKNFARLWAGLKDLEHLLILPEATPHSDPSWFGFPIAVRRDAGFACVDLVRFLDQRKIGTRKLFAGNLTRQPAFTDVKYRVAGSLDRSDFVMDQVFWVGVYPGLTDVMIDYVLTSLHDAARGAVSAVSGR